MTAAHNIAWFSEIDKEDISLAGGKGANLGEMTKAGFNVPNGFIITSHAYYDFIRENNILDSEAKAEQPADADTAIQFDQLANDDEDIDDELYNEAVNVVKEAQKASASLLQRRLKVGYARAARLLDIMEAKGIVGPGEGAKPREVFLEKPVGPEIDPEDFK